MGTPLPEGIVAVVKADCPTCQLVAPVLGELRAAGVALTVFTQDDPDFPAGLDPIDDTELDVSVALDLDTVPTLVKVEGGVEVDRLVGWSRPQWEKFTGVDGLGDGLPEYRPGCGSLSVDPEVMERLAARSTGLRSRRLELARLEDEAEAFFERGWTDGLPVVPPTPARVLRMLEGTTRAADEVVASVGPDFADCTLEKAAVNAVMAGCKPEYFPVVLAAVEAACTDEFNMHGLLCTTWFSGPVVIVNGPITREIGMNSGVNALGQGNRANATIGRALQLIVRNIGGGRPGEIDRSTFGGPGKYTFCFAEDEVNSPWEPLSVERGFAEGTSTVTLFAGDGPRGMCDQKSREPESLARSMAWQLDSVWHPKLAMLTDAVLVVSPEHARVFREAGWSKAQLRERLLELTTKPLSEISVGANGCAEGMTIQAGGVKGAFGSAVGDGGGDAAAEVLIPKFFPDGLLIVHAGGTAGLFSAVIGGWARGAIGSSPVTREVKR
ncbi:MAG TPA: thioredoxin family protein [Acidimicrobiia bacterium]|nr:thioredoxin family protein [Acidimicrobiia bacterium]